MDQRQSLGGGLAAGREAAQRVVDLPRDHVGAGACDLDRHAFRCARTRQCRLDGERLQAVSREDRERLAEGLVRGGSSAAKVVVVERGQVVVHQAEGVDELDRDRSRHGIVDRAARSARALKHQDRPQTLASSEDGVLAGCAQIRRQRVTLEEPEQCAFDGVKQRRIERSGGRGGRLRGHSPKCSAFAGAPACR